MCDQPPAPYCLSGDVLRSHSGPGECTNGACVYPFQDVACPNGCADGACLEEKCVPGQCDDGNPCTDDSCSEEGICKHVPNQAACDDGDPCTTDDRCADGVCGGMALDQDGDGYVASACGGNDCDDQDDQVNPAAFEGPAGSPACEDWVDNDCDGLTDSSDNTCAACQTDADCQDDNVCNGTEYCLNAVCMAGTPLDCDDDEPCTDDSCDPSSGCVHDPNQEPCDDGDACTEGDRCSGGICEGGTAVDCDDQNICTDDTCDPSSGCRHTPNTDPCDDENACTQGDRCSGGVCAGGAAVDCDDQNVCTDDGCDPSSGCRHTSNTNPCDDGDACTGDDQCSEGVCVGGNAIDCDDDNLCTDDSCDPGFGCYYTSNQEACDDGDPCTYDDTCQAGTCTGQPVQVCQGGDGCCPQGCSYPEDTDCTCIPATCEDLGAVCGDPPDGCGGILDCGECEPGFRCADGVCCALEAYLACHDGDVVWFDGCDNPYELHTACEANQVCSGSRCCTLEFTLGCVDNHVHWLDSCGNPGELVEECGAGQQCFQGACVTCTDHAYRICSQNTAYWYDSCFNQQEAIETCGDGAFCANGSCETYGCELDGILDLDTGYNHACAVVDGGDVLCWGNSEFGEIGDLRSGDGDVWDQDSYSRVPVRVEGLGGSAIQVTAGGWFSCALLTGGTVECWGRNNTGQLGDASTTDSLLPVEVVGLPGPVAAIDAGYMTVCAVLGSGHVMCWGLNHNGTLGDGSDDDASVPVEVRDIEDAVDVGVGRYHACAKTGSGELWCWGDNSNGQLGNGTNQSSNLPVLVAGLASVTWNISVGDWHTCAATLDGAKCWGENGSAQLGTGTIVDKNEPHQVVMNGYKYATEIAAGGSHSCAQERYNKRVKCWGSNIHYQAIPSAVGTVYTADVRFETDEAVDLSLGDDFSCAWMLDADQVLCWGINTAGQVGAAALSSEVSYQSPVVSVCR